MRQALGPRQQPPPPPTQHPMAGALPPAIFKCADPANQCSTSRENAKSTSTVLPMSFHKEGDEGQEIHSQNETKMVWASRVGWK
ncbi:hypothetical protein HPB50_006309 [Hyalomma asiaticum]|uniref:Uncharacterized protein n=1 Tax=Hyalomma asiaticum TaxID=266040 RepID=A0ACB7TFM9_HYAAI|nr:hypothetical protein HPB50_006309 [Hyalomma asiaticum]